MRCRRLLLLSVAVAVLLPLTLFASDPVPPDCDLVVQFDGTIRRYKPRLTLDELAILAEASRRAADGIEAWKTHDAERFLKDTPAAFTFRRPDGTLVTRDDLVADLKLRMSMTRSIDSIVVAIRVDTLRADSAIVRSRHWFSRVIASPDGATRRRFTGVTHRELWLRRESRWTRVGFSEENQVAHWVGEPTRLGRAVATTTGNAGGTPAFQPDCIPSTAPPDSTSYDVAPVPVTQVSPEIPQYSGTTQRVILRAYIDPQGRVCWIQVLQGVVGLTQPAVDAVKKWRFRPASLKGNPVGAWFDIPLDFEP